MLELPRIYTGVKLDFSERGLAQRVNEIFNFKAEILKRVQFDKTLIFIWSAG